ncbi:MAG: hypothetical protein WCO82_09140 [Sphingomonadales bacterium]|jgi:hypothetical protein
MKFVVGSSLSDAELEALSRSMVEEYGEGAQDVVNRLIDEANTSGKFVEHAKWINVALGVLHILRPDQNWP